MKKNTLLTALVLLAISGLIVHYRVHNPFWGDKLHPDMFTFKGTLFPSFLLPLIDVFVVTGLFMSRKTAVYGYLLNGMIVVYGTIFMAHFSIAEITAKSMPVQAIVLGSTLPDIAIAWADFFVGKALYDLYMKGQA